VTLELWKSIPVGGGLGGGSSDAAASLRLCNRFFKPELDKSTLMKIGAGLGSDVPFFFALPSAVISGRGERVESAVIRWRGWVLLVFAGRGVSTAEVYRAWRASDSLPIEAGVERDILRAVSAADINERLRNDLEPAIVRVAPYVAEVRAWLNGLGFGPFRVSGAGSTLYRLFDDLGEAERARSLIETHGFGVRASVVAAPVQERCLSIIEEK
jgi:4-diphosphocytidyl-2-C-methyl-D-erythritol kinase